MAYDIYTGLLKAFPLQQNGDGSLSLSYVYDHPKFAELKSKYPIESVAGNGGDFSKAVNLLHWVSGNIYHKGDYMNALPDNSLAYLDYALGRCIAQGINCVALSTVLAECLLSIGIKARKVFIMPCSPYDGDNHVVVNAYIKELGKWMMLDPTLNAYLSDEEGQILSILELRNHLANQEPVFFNKEAKYNDDEWTAESAKYNIEYLAKNLFYLNTTEISGFGDIDLRSQRFVTICPSGYDMKQAQLSNIEYRRKLYGEQAWMKEAIEHINQASFHFYGTTGFER